MVDKHPSTCSEDEVRRDARAANDSLFKGLKRKLDFMNPATDNSEECEVVFENLSIDMREQWKALRLEIDKVNGSTEACVKNEGTRDSPGPEIISEVFITFDQSASYSKSSNDATLVGDLSNEVVFVEAVHKDVKAKNIEVIDIPDDPPVVLKENISATQRSTENGSSTKVPSNNRYFLSPQEAASDIVKSLLARGIRRAKQLQYNFYESEVNILRNTQYQWCNDYKMKMRKGENPQAFCWRVRNYTRNTFLTLAQQMSGESSLGWTIMENYKEYRNNKMKAYKEHQVSPFYKGDTVVQNVQPKVKTEASTSQVQVDSKDSVALSMVKNETK